jgi:hypothetical protein
MSDQHLEPERFAARIRTIGGDDPVLAEEVRDEYRRARWRQAVSDLLDRFLQVEPPEEVYEAFMNTRPPRDFHPLEKED